MAVKRQIVSTRLDRTQAAALRRMARTAGKTRSQFLAHLIDVEWKSHAAWERALARDIALNGPPPSDAGTEEKRT